MVSYENRIKPFGNRDIKIFLKIPCIGSWQMLQYWLNDFFSESFVSLTYVPNHAYVVPVLPKTTSSEPFLTSSLGLGFQQPSNKFQKVIICYQTNLTCSANHSLLLLHLHTIYSIVSHPAAITELVYGVTFLYFTVTSHIATIFLAFCFCLVQWYVSFNHIVTFQWRFLLAKSSFPGTIFIYKKL